jgi:hypothetical protein
MTLFRSWRQFANNVPAGLFSDGRLEIFFNVCIGKAAIVQVDAQLLPRNGASWKQGANRIEDDLMLGFAEGARAEGLDEILSQIAGNRLIAKSAEGLKFGCEFCFAVHALVAAENDLP